MALQDVRRRLPVLGALPTPRDRSFRDADRGPAPRPAIAVWEFTLACDHRCLHCGPRAGRPRPDELTTEEALRLVAELAELGVGEVALIGGEAYLRDDFILVIRAIREHGMTSSIVTGGWGLSPERCAAAKEAGLMVVSVSIDGLEDHHDRVRAKRGSWRRAFEALGHARAAGMTVGANTQINALTIPDLLPLLDRLTEAGVAAWQLQFTMVHGSGADHPELILQPFMIPELFARLDEVADRCRERGIRLLPGNNIGYFGPSEQKLRRAQKHGGHYSGCTSGVVTLGIESNGEIKGCPSLGGPTNQGGSWRAHGLGTLWARSPEITYVRERTLDDLWGFCRTCYYADVCRGGCTATSEPLLGRPGNNPFCHHRALELERQGLRERIERVSIAPDIPFGNGLWQVVREPLDPDERARTGPVAIERPRVSRVVEPFGPGTEVDPADYVHAPGQAPITG
ncbi:MAG: radical SAM protein [Myxococcales bacterium]|nr:radical SAM protein [Myxococcales bacterium]